MSSVGRVSSLEGVHDVGALLGELVAHLRRGKPPLVQAVVVPARGDSGDTREKFRGSIAQKRYTSEI